MLSGARVNESGRSMVEMLGVLAIIGVLSVGGIAGYSKAMSKFKLTKAQDQITMALMNIRTAYASSPTYEGLNAETAASYNLVSSDMIVGDGANTTLTGAFGGDVELGDCKTSSCGVGASGAGYFYIKMGGLTKEACSSLATADWGADGLMGMRIANNDTSAGPAGTEFTSDKLPLSFADLVGEGDGEAGAVNVCGSSSSITWVYY